MNWLATVLAKLFREWLGFQQEQAEKPKTIVHADPDEKLAAEWQAYLEANGVKPADARGPEPGPFGYGVRDPKDGGVGLDQ